MAKEKQAEAPAPETSATLPPTVESTPTPPVANPTAPLPVSDLDDVDPLDFVAVARRGVAHAQKRIDDAKAAGQDTRDLEVELDNRKRQLERAMNPSL